MKRQSPMQAKNELKLSDAILAKRYLELQKLRDEVRKAEIFGMMMDALCSREPSGPHPVEFEKSASSGAGDRKH
jgi:hypothetical protein